MPYSTPEKQKAYHQVYYNRSDVKERARKNRKAWHKRTQPIRRKYASKWADNNPEINWSCKQGKKYGITYAQYLFMLKAQNNLYAACQHKETVKDHRSGKIKRFVVDHNHKTGKVRGLLCQRCNHVIGKAKDSLIILKAITKYLENNI